ETINASHLNERYLPGIALPETLVATADLTQAVDKAELVLFVVPSHATRDVAMAARPHLPADALLCNATKGIENETLMLMSEVMVDVLGDEAIPRLTYFSGPSFAKEIAAGVPTAVTVAGASREAAERVQAEFATANLRMYYTHDVAGVEVGGALKNVIAIAAGAIDGLGFGLNTRAALMTRGLAEIGRLAAAKGAEPITLAGLAGMGDLVLTCTGSLSRNRTVGVELGKGRTLDDILDKLGHVAEGVKTTKSAYELGKKLKVDMPITDQVYQVIYEDKPAKKALYDLMTRPLKHEQH
ncbi:MAG TPA: NAD(P)-dependent glycerol-3-phosphate dehydrogenase, partial [Polyangiaceae bacterium]|nr:NAD(P)-dependent glycerol-3-phosphate dehydrogenase [Polyangiaceae bacterium]